MAMHGGKRYAMVFDPRSSTPSIPSSETSLLDGKSSASPFMQRSWFEEECRAFIIKHCQFIPQNYGYVDGLKLLYPLLLRAFGAENLPLIKGVVSELIEVEEPPPYPESLFQRWKFCHIQSGGDIYTSPSSFANRALQPIVPTRKLLGWRSSQKMTRSMMPACVRSILQGQSIGVMEKYFGDYTPKLGLLNSESDPNAFDNAQHNPTTRNKTFRLSLKQVILRRVLQSMLKDDRGGGMLLLTESCHDEAAIQELTSEKGKAKTFSRDQLPCRRLVKRIKLCLNAQPNVDRAEVKDALMPTANSNFVRKFHVAKPDLLLKASGFASSGIGYQKVFDPHEDSWQAAFKAATKTRTKLDFKPVPNPEACSVQPMSDPIARPLTPNLFFDCHNDFDFEVDQIRKSPVSNTCVTSEHEDIVQMMSTTSRNAHQELGDQKAKTISPGTIEPATVISDLPLRNLTNQSQTNIVLTEIILMNQVFDMLPERTYIPNRASTTKVPAIECQEAGDVYGPFIILSTSANSSQLDLSHSLESRFVD